MQSKASVEDLGNVVQKKNPTIQFSRNILKSVVGNEKAANAFASISMASIPNAKDNKALSIESKFNFKISFCSAAQSTLV